MFSEYRYKGKKEEFSESVPYDFTLVIRLSLFLLKKKFPLAAQLRPPLF